ncbi:hypothetical protein CY34DRAFT_807122 [Suillus luteus UH-Slu-Lm8-n1]|uniref:Uncharacterized protein n=1 Tax=Suillus luteus UH-Slu-Lm8-n1 TaxID=930992 RepID=A0A0C9ZRW3_9AGAM|nr:hypothetical protein CY34DRAFT_807122 [Suillus luteus UH-Slu-Lm8-n1]
MVENILFRSPTASSGQRMARALSGRQSVYSKEGASEPDNPSSLKVWVPKRREA